MVASHRNSRITSYKNSKSIPIHIIYIYIPLPLHRTVYALFNIYYIHFFIDKNMTRQYTVTYFDIMILAAIYGCSMLVSISCFKLLSRNKLFLYLQKAHKINLFFEKAHAGTIFKELSYNLPEFISGLDYTIERCGSVLEGYGYFSEEVTGVEQDMDLTIIINKFPVNLDSLDSNNTPCGFTWVQVEKDKLSKLGAPIDTETLIEHIGGKDYFNIGKFFSCVYRNAVENFQSDLETAGQFQLHLNPPVITIVAKNKRHGFMNSIDMGIGLKLDLFPSDALEWLNRKDRDGKIDFGLIQKIAKEGGLLVYKPSKKSQNEELDFRYSFSKAEGLMMKFFKDKIALRLVYIMSRYIYKTRLKKKLDGSKVLCSYHLKTAYLWMAESANENKLFDQRDVSKKTVAKLFVHFLKTLREYYTEHNLPHFFIRESNLLDQYSTKEVQLVTHLLTDVISCPLDKLSYIEDTKIALLKIEDLSEKEQALLDIINQAENIGCWQKCVIAGLQFCFVGFFLKVFLNFFGMDIAVVTSI